MHKTHQLQYDLPLSFFDLYPYLVKIIFAFDLYLQGCELSHSLHDEANDALYLYLRLYY